MAAEKGLRDVAVTETRYHNPKEKRKKVQVYPKLELEIRDVPELGKKKYGERCMLLVEAEVLNVGMQDRYVPEGEKQEPKVLLQIKKVQPYAGKPSGAGEDDKPLRAGKGPLKGY